MTLTRGAPRVVALAVTVVGAAAIISGFLLPAGSRIAPQWLASGSYACTRTNPSGGPPQATGQVLGPLGPGGYSFEAPTPVAPGAVSTGPPTGDGAYTSTTIERGQYGLKFTSGPLEGTQGDYVILQRGKLTVSYVVLAGGAADALACTLRR